jgi:nicotinamidase-related amidase
MDSQMDLSLDPKTTALVLIDLQNGIAARQLAPHSSQDVIRNSIRIADSLRQAGGTIVFVRVLLGETLRLPADSPNPRPPGPPSPQASELVPEIVVQPGDQVVVKRQWGAFYGTNLEQHLRRRAIRTIILGGIATNFGVESTARAAFDQGYEVVFAENAMSSVSAEAHNFVIQNIFPRMGRVRSTDQILAAFGAPPL